MLMQEYEEFDITIHSIEVIAGREIAADESAKSLSLYVLHSH